MRTLSIANRDLLCSLSWYMSARRTSLRSALSFRAPLSFTDQADMRVHYSDYFLNLMASADLLKDFDTLKPIGFEAQLHSRLVFNEFPNGMENHSYVRELRNSVVHRGLDITSAAHFDGNFPMILAEPKVQDRNGKKTHVAFDKYLLHIIDKCESVYGPVMLDSLSAAGFFETPKDVETAISEFREAVDQSHAMPDFAKLMALEVSFKPEWAMAAHSAAMNKLREALAPCHIPRSTWVWTPTH